MIRRPARAASRLALAFAAVTLASGTPAHAIERILVSAESMTMGAAVVHEVTLELTIPSSRRSVLEAHAGEIDLPPAVRGQIGRLTALHVHCDNPAFREPLVTCPAFVADGHAGRLPPLHVEGDTRIDVEAGAVRIAGRGPTLAGAPVVFDFDGSARDFDAHASLPSLDFTALAELIAPWYPLPAGVLPKGHAALSLEAGSRAGEASAVVHADLADVSYANADGTVVADALRGQLRAQLHGLAPLDAEISLEATSGQVLAGPVYVDFAANPLRAGSRAVVEDGTVQLTSLSLAQRDLAQLGGVARLRLNPLAIDAAQLELTDLRFPAAYRSLLQIALTTTPFSALTTSGRATGSLRIADGQPAAIDVALDGLSFADAKRGLDVRGVEAEVHWTSASAGPPRPSFLAWESARGWSVEGGKARIDFLTQQHDVRLTKPARLPLWDGALVVNTLEAADLGSDAFTGRFDAQLEPISLPRITRAFGWPEFGGRISGRIPGLTYGDHLLTVQGDLEASVFDGTITARRLRVRDPLGPWPRLYADVEARNLDLEQITRTFSFGSITGRLDGNLTGLETFGASPVAFDLRLETPERDRSRHRISQTAVKNLASIGGGGGGVAAALQSGALRFFDTFRYERLGLACKLANDVCEMSGVERAKNGYYIVKGSGLPRIDIIGSEARVDWPRLVSQVRAALQSSADVRVD